MSEALRKYINFKLDQKLRLMGFDYNQENAKAEIKAVAGANMKMWVREAVAAGI